MVCFADSDDDDDDDDDDGDVEEERKIRFTRCQIIGGYFLFW